MVVGFWVTSTASIALAKQLKGDSMSQYKRVHELKCDPDPFDLTRIRRKPFEIRKNDRGFEVGDTVVLNETQFSCEEMKNGQPLEYTGRKEYRVITCITQGYGLEPGFVVLGFGGTYVR
jgi:hypothetical protein